MSTVNGKGYAIHFGFTSYTRPGSYTLSEAAGDQIDVFELPIGNTGHYWDGGTESQLVTIGPDQRSGEIRLHLRAVFGMDPFHPPGPSVASNGPSLNIEGSWSC